MTSYGGSAASGVGAGGYIGCARAISGLAKTSSRRPATASCFLTTPFPRLLLSTQRGLRAPRDENRAMAHLVPKNPVGADPRSGHTATGRGLPSPHLPGSAPARMMEI